VRNIAVVRASLGVDGVLALLETVHGADAIAILRSEGAVVGTGTRILRGLVVHNASSDLSQLSIGSDCHIGRQVLVDLASPVRIGDRVTISMRVMLITHTNVGDSRCGLPSRSAGIEIGDDAYIGAGATILSGVRIGKAAIVGAGAVVTRDVDPATTVIGIPAKTRALPIMNASAQQPSVGAPND
jgi:serine acetyltransferase